MIRVFGKNFDFPHERTAFRKLYHLLNKSQTSEDIFLLINVPIEKSTPDIIIIKNKAISVVEMKNYGNKITYPINRDNLFDKNSWLSIDENNNETIINEDMSNPYAQVKTNTRALELFLEKHEGEIIDEKYHGNVWGYIKRTILFTGEHVFFKHKTSTASWGAAYSLTSFGKNNNGSNIIDYINDSLVTGPRDYKNDKNISLIHLSSKCIENICDKLNISEITEQYDIDDIDIKDLDVLEDEINKAKKETQLQKIEVIKLNKEIELLKNNNETQHQIEIEKLNKTINQKVDDIDKNNEKLKYYNSLFEDLNFEPHEEAFGFSSIKLKNLINNVDENLSPEQFKPNATSLKYSKEIRLLEYYLKSIIEQSKYNAKVAFTNANLINFHPIENINESIFSTNKPYKPLKLDKISGKLRTDDPSLTYGFYLHVFKEKGWLYVEPLFFCEVLFSQKWKNFFSKSMFIKNEKNISIQINTILLNKIPPFNKLDKTQFSKKIDSIYSKCNNNKEIIDEILSEIDSNYDPHSIFNLGMIDYKALNLANSAFINNSIIYLPKNSYYHHLISELEIILEKWKYNENNKIKNKDLAYKLLTGKKINIFEPVTHQSINIDRLNYEQSKAITTAISEKNKISVISGPPGTGKTQLGINLIANLHSKKKKVLFASRNKKAVSVLEKRYNEIFKKIVISNKSKKISFKRKFESISNSRIKTNASQTKLNSLSKKIEKLIHLKKEYELINENIDSEISTSIEEIEILPWKDQKIEVDTSLIKKTIKEYESKLTSIHNLSLKLKDSIYNLKKCETFLNNFQIDLNQKINSTNKKIKELDMIKGEWKGLNKVFNEEVENFNNILLVFFHIAFNNKYQFNIWDILSINKRTKKIENFIYSNVRNKLKNILNSKVSISFDKFHYESKRTQIIQTSTNNLKIKFINYFNEFTKIESNKLSKYASNIDLLEKIQTDDILKDFNVYLYKKFFPFLKKLYAHDEKAIDLYSNLKDINKICVEDIKENIDNYYSNRFLDFFSSYNNSFTIDNIYRILKNQIYKIDKLLNLNKSFFHCLDYINNNDEDMLYESWDKTTNLNINHSINLLGKNIYSKYAQNDLTTISTNLSIKKEDKEIEPLKYDLAIIDEASQTDFISSIPIIYRSKKLVVIGDEKQLPPIVSTYTKKIDYVLYDAYKLDKSLYELFGYANSSLLSISNKIVKNKRTMLLNHYRSHPDIIGFSNKYFYNNKLRIQTNSNNTPGIAWLEHSYDCNPKWTSPKEIDIILKALDKWNRTGSHKMSEIGIVTPFRAQADLIQRKIDANLKTSDSSDILIDTAHKFQGDQKEAIIISLVIGPSMPKNTINWIDVSEKNVLNVALTRAKTKLLIIGNNNSLVSRNNNNLLNLLYRYTRYINE